MIGAQRRHQTFKPIDLAALAIQPFFGDGGDNFAEPPRYRLDEWRRLKLRFMGRNDFAAMTMAGYQCRRLFDVRGMFPRLGMPRPRIFATTVLYQLTQRKMPCVRYEFGHSRGHHH
jgi:hypothetical protein